jgi:hypothetical protein
VLALSTAWDCRGAVATVAPTGVAASLIDGATLHSYIQLKRESRVERTTDTPHHIKRTIELIKMHRKTRLLFVDEVSMASLHLLGRLHDFLRQVRQCDQAFGGLSIVFCGDLYQLALVGDLPVWSQSTVHTATQISGRSAWHCIDTVMFLRENKRADCPRYREFLRNLRNAALTPEDIRAVVTFPTPTGDVYVQFGYDPIKDRATQLNNQVRLQFLLLLAIELISTSILCPLSSFLYQGLLPNAINITAFESPHTFAKALIDLNPQDLANLRRDFFFATDLCWTLTRRKYGSGTGTQYIGLRVGPLGGPSTTADPTATAAPSTTAAPTTTASPATTAAPTTTAAPSTTGATSQPMQTPDADIATMYVIHVVHSIDVSVTKSLIQPNHNFSNGDALAGELLLRGGVVSSSATTAAPTSAAHSMTSSATTLSDLSHMYVFLPVSIHCHLPPPPTSAKIPILTTPTPHY